MVAAMHTLSRNSLEYGSSNATNYCEDCPVVIN